MGKPRLPTESEKNLWLSAMGDVKSFVPKPLPAIPKLSIKERPIDVPTMDLHGMTVQVAYDAVRHHLDTWKNKTKFVSFITGQSGAIRREFSHWVQKHPSVRNIEPMNGGGAFKVYFKKPK